MYRLLVCLLFCCQGLFALPADVQGHWSGECTVYSTSATTHFNMTLDVTRETETSWSWKIGYDFPDERPTEVRNYSLIARDLSVGHYYIDENNGLKLDSFWKAAALYSTFLINGRLVTATYRFAGEHLEVQMPVYGITPLEPTCLTASPNLCAQSLQLFSTQVCKLVKN